jgi:DHA2 family multidrug resistance protein
MGPLHRWFDPATKGGVALLDRMVNQQAQIVAYVDDYVLLIMTTLPALLLLLLMRMPRKGAVPVETQAME